ncbi:MAG TPA: hypothetical protein DCY79_18980 [Planctomycetaceae bacterium]|nr:hypothetical protein [Blastopirellula sp.]HAY81892.1 hypothetical protein [Planctomycetaceae bacterium]
MEAMMNSLRLSTLILMLATANAAAQSSTPADIESQLERARQSIPQQTFVLQYKFTPGEAIRWTVTHQASTETKIKGTTQTAESKTVSTKVWKVLKVDDEGRVTFVNSVEQVNMWNKVTGRPAVSYDSSQDEEVPPVYEQAAKTVGIPLSQVTVTNSGRIKAQKKTTQNPDMGLGQIIFPFPEEPIKIGQSWVVPNTVAVSLGEGRVKQIKIRQRYTLEKVRNSVATIRLKTETVTPVNDPRIESQLVQKLTTGEIKFDLSAGRVRSKHVEWDETVVGFSGPDSSMQYLARFTEQLDTSRTNVAAKPSPQPAPAEPIGPKLQ